MCQRLHCCVAFLQIEIWRPFDRMYEVSSAGVIRKKATKRPVNVELPRAGGPMQYVRLVLKDAPEPKAGNNQKRLTLRNVVAHCWLSDATGFQLTEQGTPARACFTWISMPAPAVRQSYGDGRAGGGQHRAAGQHIDREGEEGPKALSSQVVKSCLH